MGVLKQLLTVVSDRDSIGGIDKTGVRTKVHAEMKWKVIRYTSTKATEEVELFVRTKDGGVLKTVNKDTDLRQQDYGIKLLARDDVPPNCVGGANNALLLAYMLEKMIRDEKIFQVEWTRFDKTSVIEVSRGFMEGVKKLTLVIEFDAISNLFMTKATIVTGTGTVEDLFTIKDTLVVKGQTLETQYLFPMLQTIGFI